MKLKLYSVNSNYIKFLRKFDNKVYENKEEKLHGRKYLGVVLSINDFNYYIPMSSPKATDYIDLENKIIRKDSKTIIRMHYGKRLFVTLRISNMIPVPSSVLEPYVLSDERDLKYKEIIQSELRYIDKNSKRIEKYASRLYNNKIKNINAEYINNTVDFKILESKLKEWKNNKN